jgi:baculoviral IAP repeat-containing protein 6
LPVLVAIQSLILNAEPYYNEPGYEKSRGTEAGERNSREYNAGIEIATVEWAMLDQIRHPSACFKDVIHRHFWLKRAEVLSQCEKWLENLIVTCRNDKRAGKHVTGSSDPVTVFKNNLALLKKELGNMKPPEGLEDLGDFSTPVPTSSNPISTTTVFPTSSSSATTTSPEEADAGAGKEDPASSNPEPSPPLPPPPENTNGTGGSSIGKSDLKNVDNLKKLLSANSATELLDVDDVDEDEDDGELDEDYVEDEEDEEYTMLMDM